ncbi:MAG: response regulator [Thiothrix sp.]|nr:MAG: response regulator [Thiothrix sp.]
MAHILVVDDSATDQYVFKQVLEKNGHQVTVAKEGKEGVSLARQLKPDLILMDVVMPVLNGFQATRELARSDSTRQIPIIMITSKDAESDVQWAKRQGASAYIVKPVKEGRLIECIGRLLETPPI